MLQIIRNDMSVVLSSLAILIVHFQVLQAVPLSSVQSTPQHQNESSEGFTKVSVFDRNNATRGSFEDSNAWSLDSPGSVAETTSAEHRGQFLGSLTFQQRETRATSASDLILDDSVKLINRTNEIRTSKDPLDQWKEIKLKKFRPSWLNVSSQFKITGTTVEEQAALMPPEYLVRAAFDSPILLKTKMGIIEGVSSIKFNKRLYTFLSVPYAKAPVEDLRFKAPQPFEKWDGILQATKWPPFCVQPSMTLASKSSPVHVLSQIMTEDCLYLNIWTPSLRLTTDSGKKRPVMVWLHGGAFQYGGISVDENDGSALALLGDVVVVTLNYRISAFGFLNANNQKNGPNNVGIQDQRMALEWVQANIRQFGGDPDQVTLFGESAGGHSVGLHLISPASYPLFRRAIMQSGVPISMLRSYDANSDNTGSVVAEAISSIMMAKRLGCYPQAQNQSAASPDLPANATSEEVEIDLSEEEESKTAETPVETEPQILDDSTIECLRNKTSLELLLALGLPGSAGFFPTGKDSKGVFPNGPIMDSFDPDNVKIGPQKDFLIGTNTDEGTFMLHYGLPKVFPARKPPLVSNIDEFKEAVTSEISKGLPRSSKQSPPPNTQVLSRQASGAQAHLYKPLLKTGTSILERFLPKSNIQVFENGTVVGNTTAYSKNGDFGNRLGGFVSDMLFLCPSRSLARTLSESKRNVYFYLYGHRSSRSQYHEWFGTTHHDEVEFVFGRPLRLANVYSGKDIDMSQRMIKIWSHFAHTGQMLDQYGVKWPKYDPEDNDYMFLQTDKASLGQRYHDKFCNVYDTVISVHLQDVGS